MNNAWRPIAGYESAYLVSDKGEIWSVKSNRCLALKKTPAGYLRIVLCVNGNPATFSVHRLVAQAFINNPDAKPTVNHINEIKTDNRVENLEWATCREQNIHGTRIARAMANTDWVARSKKIDYAEVARKHRYNEMNRKQMKPVLQFDKHGNFIDRFDSVSAAARALYCTPCQICECLKGRRRTGAGYKWKYEQTDNTSLAV